MALYAGGYEETAGVRPGDDLVLTPPPEYGSCMIAPHFLKEITKKNPLSHVLGGLPGKTCRLFRKNLNGWQRLENGQQIQKVLVL